MTFNENIDSSRRVEQAMISIRQGGYSWRDRRKLIIELLNSYARNGEQGEGEHTFKGRLIRIFAKSGSPALLWLLFAFIEAAPINVVRYILEFFERLTPFYTPTSVIASMRTKKPRTYVFLAANYGNLGDIAITNAQSAYLRKMMPRHEQVEVPITETYRSLSYIKRHINPDDVITFVGGGNFGSLYTTTERMRQRLVSAFPNNQIISFPQSIYFGDDPASHRLLKRSQRIYSSHSKLTICVRDQKSMDRAKSLFPRNPVILAPDIVLSAVYRHSQKRDVGVVVVSLRSDKESALAYGQRQELLNLLTGKFKRIIMRDTDLGEIRLTSQDGKRQVNSLWGAYARSAVVVTDRLHGMIFCAVTRTRCIAIDNNNGKLSAFYKKWLESVDYVNLMDGSDVSAIAKELEARKSGEDNRRVSFNSQFEALDHFFSKLDKTATPQKTDSKGDDLMRNTLILGIGKVSIQAATFLLIPLFTYFLSPEQYGFVDLTITYIALLAPALTLQLEMASFRFLIDARSDDAEKIKVISNVLYLTGILTVAYGIIFLVIGMLAGLNYLLPILMVGVSTIFSNMLLQMARGLGRNVVFARACIVAAITLVIGAIYFVAFSRLGILGMFITLGVSNLAAITYTSLALGLHRYYRKTVISRDIQKGLIGYSAPLVPNGASWWVISLSDRAVISFLIGIGANGIYAVSSKYGAIFTGFWSIFEMSWTESASLHINGKDRDTFFSAVFNRAAGLFGALALILIATIPFIFPLLVNYTFHDAYYYIPILVVAAYFNMFSGFYGAIYIAKRYSKKVMSTSLFAAVLNIILTVLLVPYIGLYAAAIATLIAFLSMAIFRHFDVRKYVKIRHQMAPLLLIAMLFVVVLSTYYLENIFLSLAALLVVFAASYALNRRTIIGMVGRFIHRRTVR